MTRLEEVRGESVVLYVSAAHIDAMVAGPLKDELGYAYRNAVRRRAEREESADDFAERVRLGADRERIRAVVQYGDDAEGVAEHRLKHLDSLHVWTFKYGEAS